MTSPFPSPYEEIIYKTRYAKWLDGENRREDWDETVHRLVEYYAKQAPVIVGETAKELYSAIYELEVMPSMRALMTAGPALDHCNVGAYNCAYMPVDSLRSFDEAFYILMCGTGVGYSVENKYVDKLPRIAEDFTDSDTTIIVGDSREGWARALRELLSLLVCGQIPRWDVSRVRPAGARLRTFGGRASGPKPLVELFEYAISVFRGAAGRRLSSLECHDLLCNIGSAVVVGGVRRSALIALFDVTDDRMATSKHGAWFDYTPNRSLANNSAVYENRRPDMGFFMKKWQEIYDSKSGEPGIFSRYTCQAIAGRNGRRDNTFEFGTNPCSEIILRPFQFCNLTEVIVRATDSLDDLRRKVRLATILGTIQSSFTNFKYLRKIWRTQCEEERLLGVSLTGLADRSRLSGAEIEQLRDVAIATNQEWAERLGINPSTAITCIKPSGTVSQLVDAASGLHRRHSRYYLRSIRGDNKDPVTAFLKAQGVPNEPDLMKPEATTVFYFAKKAPETAQLRETETAISAMEDWLFYQEHWCEHKPSTTIYIKDDEWLDAAAWVYKNFDKVSGCAFLPYDGGTYKQAPYQEITKEEYEAFIEANPLPSIDWGLLSEFEQEDTTTSAHEFACVAGSCDITNL